MLFRFRQRRLLKNIAEELAIKTFKNSASIVATIRDRRAPYKVSHEFLFELTIILHSFALAIYSRFAAEFLQMPYLKYLIERTFDRMSLFAVIGMTRGNPTVATKWFLRDVPMISKYLLNQDSLMMFSRLGKLEAELELDHSIVCQLSRLLKPALFAPVPVYNADQPSGLWEAAFTEDKWGDKEEEMTKWSEEILQSFRILIQNELTKAGFAHR